MKLKGKRYELPRRRVPALPSGPRPAAPEDALEQLKKRLLAEVLSDSPAPLPRAAIRRAANEATALAWLTPYPLLFLPGLLQEKAQTAVAQARRQQWVRAQSPKLKRWPAGSEKVGAESEP
jgi:hypothetical protein